MHDGTIATTIGRPFTPIVRDGRTAPLSSPLPASPGHGHIRVPARHNPHLQRLIAQVNRSPDVWALWQCANVNAMDRLGISDHGWVHAQVVANLGLKLLRLLGEAGISPSSVRHHSLTPEDAEVIVVTAALLHDVGIAIHRDEHEHFSLLAAGSVLRDLLSPVYLDPVRRTIIWSEVLHAIISHHRDIRCLTVEAGIVKVADALDMTKGRYRVPFEAGKLDIHSVSTTAIERVRLSRGAAKPVRIDITLSNSVGLFQLDELLRRKLHTSGLADHVELAAQVAGDIPRSGYSPPMCSMEEPWRSPVREQHPRAKRQGRAVAETFSKEKGPNVW
ncbi:MAG: HD domain-containing protein [Chloroflexi bacterium]|nr:HD domain-containing protein [Chloroflexota bacterium]